MNDVALIKQFADARESARDRYVRMFVGRPGLLPLIRYELLTGLLGPLTGALGYWLRARLYPRLFDRVGRGVLFGRSLVLRCPGRIRLGDNVVLDDHVVLDAKGEGSRLVLGSNILVGRLSVLSCHAATIEMGDNVSIGPFCHFASKAFLRIGSNTGIGADVHVIAGGYRETDPTLPVIAQERYARGIEIGENVWIGVGARILDGVTIGRNSVVGAGSVVTKDVPPYTVVLGNPARVVQRREASPAPATPAAPAAPAAPGVSAESAASPEVEAIPATLTV